MITLKDRSGEHPFTVGAALRLLLRYGLYGDNTHVIEIARESVTVHPSGAREPFTLRGNETEMTPIVKATRAYTGLQVAQFKKQHDEPVDVYAPLNELTLERLGHIRSLGILAGLVVLGLDTEDSEEETHRISGLGIEAVGLLAKLSLDLDRPAAELVVGFFHDRMVTDRLTRHVNNAFIDALIQRVKDGDKRNVFEIAQALNATS